MSHPNGVVGRLSTTPPPPPVRSSSRCHLASWGSETATANVARASDTPASLSAGNPEQDADDPRDQACYGNGEDRAHPVADRQPVRRLEQQRFEPRLAERQHRTHVGADHHERAVPERDLPVVAGEDVQPEQRDEVDRDERELREAKLAHEPRQDDDHERGGREDRDPDDREQVPSHTRLTARWPNSPCGRMIRTSSRIASAVGRRSSAGTT